MRNCALMGQQEEELDPALNNTSNCLAERGDLFHVRNVALYHSTGLVTGCIEVV